MNATPIAAPSAPQRIAILGAGRIGSAFAFQLARTGHHDVTAIARPSSARFEQLQRASGILNTKGEHAAVRLADTLDEQIPYDLLIVTLLAHQIDAVLPQLQRSAARQILFMLNTFNPERLRDAIGPDRSAFGMPFVQASFDPDGRLNAVIGAAGQKSKISDQACVDLFLAAGLPATFEPNMLLWLRCHAPLCAAFESISVAAIRRGGGASFAEALVVARGLQESFTLIQRLGYRLYPAGKSLLHTSPAWVAASMLWSLSRIPSFRELLATGLTECRALVDVLVAHAALANPPVSIARIEAMKPSEER